MSRPSAFDFVVRVGGLDIFYVVVGHDKMRGAWWLLRKISSKS